MKDFFDRHIGGLIGAGVMVALGVLFLTIGFFKTLFLFIMAVIGFIIGSKRVREAFAETFKRVFGKEQD